MWVEVKEVGVDGPPSEGLDRAPLLKGLGPERTTVRWDAPVPSARWVTGASGSETAETGETPAVVDEGRSRYDTS